MNELNEFLYIYAFEENIYNDTLVRGKISYLKNVHTIAKQNIPEFIKNFKIQNKKDANFFFNLITEEIEYLIKQINENNSCN